MPHLSPTTLTTDEQRLILRATAGNLRDHTIVSLALGTGLRLAEIVGLDVGDVFAPDGTPRVRVRVRSTIAKGGRGETFKGEHPAIVTKAVFDRVQRLLDSNRRNSGASHRNRHGALLRGILRCAACDSSMTHAFTERRGKAFRYYRCVNAIKNGADACPTGSVPAAKIEDFVVEQIKRIGTDPALCDETFRRVQAQVAGKQRGLKAEAKRLERDLAAVRAELDRLTAAVSRATGVAADALMAKLGETQERVTTLERRQGEITDRQATLDGRGVEPAAVGRALAQFTELWDVLLTPERERVVHLLIERVDYHGANGELKISFSATGAKLLAAEVAP